MVRNMTTYNIFELLKNKFPKFYELDSEELESLKMLIRDLDIQDVADYIINNYHTLDKDIIKKILLMVSKNNQVCIEGIFEILSETNKICEELYNICIELEEDIYIKYNNDLDILNLTKEELGYLEKYLTRNKKTELLEEINKKKC